MKIKAIDFAEMYEMPVDTLYPYLNRYPQYKVVINDEVYVDMDKLQEDNFRNQMIWHFATQIYYPLVEIFGDDEKLAERLSYETKFTKKQWLKFLDVTLWRSYDDRPLVYSLNEKTIIFAYKGAKYLSLYKRSLE